MNTYYFLLTTEFPELDEQLEKQFGVTESSDISDVEGWIIDEEQRKNLMNDEQFTGHIVTFKLPEEYQNDITAFRTDYWDGNIALFYNNGISWDVHRHINEVYWDQRKE